MLDKKIDLRCRSDEMQLLSPELLKRLSKAPSQRAQESDNAPPNVQQVIDTFFATSADSDEDVTQKKKGTDQIENLFLRVVTLRLRNSQRTYETILMVTNIAVIILTVLRNEMVVSSSYISTNNIMSLVGTFLSLLSWVVLYLRYDVACIIYNKKYGYKVGFFGYLFRARCKKLVRFVAELLINAVHPFPFVTTGSAWITLFVFLRVYPLLWLVSRFSLIMRQKDLIRQAFMPMGGSRVPRFQAALGLKELMHTHSVPTLTLILLVMIPSIAYIMFYSDRLVAEPAFDKYGQTIYWTLITVASVGYGDFYPTHDNMPGLVIACFAAVIGAVIVSAVSGVIVSALEISDSERMAESVTNRRCSIANLRSLCTKLLKKAVRLSLMLQFQKLLNKPKQPNQQPQPSKQSKQFEIERENLKQGFFVTLSEKKEKQRLLMADVSYGDHFVVSDALTELLLFEEEQRNQLTTCIKSIMKVRTILAVVCNALGIDLEKLFPPQPQ